MKLSRTFLFALFAFALSTSFGQNKAETHDGFFLNLALGVNFGALTFEENISNEELRNTGAGAALDILIGGSIAENTILHATISSVNVANPEIEADNFSASTEDLILGTVFYGVGATFYTDNNFFFSPNVGTSIVVIDFDGDTERSGAGLGFMARAGKEWWIGDQWGMGVALAYRIASGTTDLGGGAEEKWRAGNFSVSLSATLN